MKEGGQKVQMSSYKVEINPRDGTYNVMSGVNTAV